MKILVTGTTTYSDNRGVSAMAACTAKILRKHFPGAEIVIWHSEICRRKSPTTYEHDVRLVKEGSALGYYMKQPVRLLLCAKWKALGRRFGRILMGENVLREYRDADLIVSLNYGDDFTDNYGLLEAASVFSQNMLNDLSGKPVVYFPQSIGKFNMGITRSLARYLLNRSKLIMVREHITEEYLKGIGVDSRLVQHVPDTAFLLDPCDDAKAAKILSEEGLKMDLKGRSKPIFGISVNPSIAVFSNVPEKREQYLEMTVALVDHLTEKMGAVVVFVPNVALLEGEDTRSFANSVKERAKRRDDVISIKGDYTAEELKGVIKQCDLFIGSLTHTVIAATSMNIPTVAISYSHKTPGVMELVGLGDYVIDFKEMSLETLVPKIENAWGARAKLKEEMKPRTDSIKERVMASGELVKKALSS